jgi:predicted metal-binding membrane protein
LGTIIGNFVTAWLSDMNKTPDGAVDWIPVWMVMTVASAVMTVAFFMLFHDKIAEKKEAEGESEPVPAE